MNEKLFMRRPPVEGWSSSGYSL